MQQEVQKALKIHNANKELSAKNALMKKVVDNMQLEQKNAIDAKDLEIQTKLK